MEKTEFWDEMRSDLCYNQKSRKEKGLMKKLGFGCMRLPLIGGPEGHVDMDHFKAMVDAYMASGYCYFDTAVVYLGGESETALREGLISRYPREQFVLTDKLSGSRFQSEADICPLFERQLRATGVEYFDYYLMHSQSAEVYEKFIGCNAYNVVRQLKKEGKIRHWGISFHDKPEVLERILSENPDIEVVQIQLNYLDYDDPSIEGGKVYEICRKFNKPIFIMEPVKGGALANLSEDAKTLLAALGDDSPASYALRYAAGFEGVEMVLSGMSTLDQVLDNIRVFDDLRPITGEEMEVLEQVRQKIRSENQIACTGCRYCVSGCPMKILIPDLFSCYNSKQRYESWGPEFYYDVHTLDRGKASDCIGCGKCEKICPQHLEVRKLLKITADAFETV